MSLLDGLDLAKGVCSLAIPGIVGEGRHLP